MHSFAGETTNVRKLLASVTLVLAFAAFACEEKAPPPAAPPPKPAAPAPAAAPATAPAAAGTATPAAPAP